MSHGDPDNWWRCSDCGAIEAQTPSSRMEGWKLAGWVLDKTLPEVRLLCPRCVTGIRPSLCPRLIQCRGLSGLC